ncbi:ABC transporter substrate-binding protein [Zhouia sp. PK063]|uniref:ABC transporter substrate-binding protein n=1 Tax=Zhouia sp. PK063 TaxID=3373602 RepID=UPI0037ABCC99
MLSYKDQLGRIITLAKSPKSIISLVPSQTELLCDLGLEANIVGVTKFCIHPYHLKSVKTMVGGTKNVHLDKIKALQPDIILCNKEENTPEMVEMLQEIAPVHVSDIETIDDTIELITLYGVLFSCRTEAIKIIQKLQFKLNDFKEFVAQQPSLKVIYFIWRAPWMVAANGTFIHHLLVLNGFENVYADEFRYPEVELKKLRLKGDADVVLLSSEPYPFKEEHAFEVGRFTHHAKTVFVDGEYFSWYGTRLLRAFDYFKVLRKQL